jgi:hypothetical protein
MITFNVLNVEREKIIEMLSYEEKVKYSDEIQEIYSSQYINKTPLNIDIEIQCHVLQNFGFTSTQKDLEEYWKIPKKYWNDNEVKNSIFYMRYNIFEYSQIKKGESIPKCRLINPFFPDKIIELSTLQTYKPLILLAGSIT